jgi:hypothetical protein
MTTPNKPPTDAGADDSFLERLSIELVLLPRERDGGARADAESSVVIGRWLLSETAGRRPLIAVVEMMGGAYRCASIAVDVETEQLARHNRRISDRLRRRGRG